MSDRSEQLLCGLTKTDRIIEIGPLHAPIAPKAEGWATTVVDHAPREELLAKYMGHEHVDPELIQEVDVIWCGGTLHDAFPAEEQGGYHALIASHVIEHVPDVIGFLDSASRLLDPQQGVVVLAIPDKRWCFDLFKPVSTTGQMLAAHRTRLVRHSPDKLFDHAAYSASNRGVDCWGRAKLSDVRFYVRLEDAKLAFDAWSDAPDAPYVDSHAWQFTPSSFELLILELGEVGAADWRIDWIAEQPNAEFSLHLRRGRQRFASLKERDARRIELLKGIARELREQANWQLEDPIASDADAVASDSVGTVPDSSASVVAATAARLNQIEADLGRLHESLRPVHSLLSTLLPMRRIVARLRGRV
ncbi:methyltransferase domain-containing protein [uncultured Thiodictyon sp.]|uniref:methyltransferase domain-containing protein n=1 Tax=uncultured Thiodictyon sp. TaxID=1846217 RepID=UPI0025D964DD|nr:methyltransferase domain-containing protein [uncultured Thiodictyon sp.]